MNSNLLSYIEDSSENLIILGKAGVGKSTLIKVLKKKLGKQCIVVCPTGIAAQNVKGQTINSFFRIPPRDEVAAWELRRSGEKLAELLESDLSELTTIIIDEISMVNQFVLEAISTVLKIARNNPTPFGGMRMILIGDLFQLPPVDIGGRLGDKIFFWHSLSFKQAKFKNFELGQVYRQEANEENKKFLETLNRIRLYEATKSDIDFLNYSFLSNTDYLNKTTLCTTRASADHYNNQGLLNLNTREFEFLADIRGDWNISDFPKPKNLSLKVGAPVLFMRNDPMGNYQNGTRGVINEINYNDRKLRVRLNPEKVIEVQYETWAHPKYNKAGQDETIVASDTFKHFPLILGFALTIHRCQGMTLDSIHLDLGRGAFAPGQLYVALSRLRNFSGLSIGRKISTNDILASEEIKDFYRSLNPFIAQLNLTGADIQGINIINETIIEVGGKSITSPEISRILFKKGCDLEDIQNERARLGFKEVLPNTIIGHIISKHIEFSREELDRILPVPKELEESVVAQLKKMEINEETKLTDIRNNLVENEIDWNVLKLIGYRNKLIQAR
jgi:DNA polymerase III delta prime subunit